MEESGGVVEEAMLPGFRFHPTDEELVGFYLKKKIQQKPLPIELIKQLDIYKFDPWDLPKLASTGEKEWYFYCPRDRKYRNSARPNRVTGAGFWKATGTDRSIYSSQGSKCIGLKKSLVFYKGKAAKGIKTDWMMHEFRLPSFSDSRFPDRNIPPTEAWAICRIFKKANSNNQRVFPNSFTPSEHDTITTPSTINHGITLNNMESNSSNIATCSNNINSPLQFAACHGFFPTSFPHQMESCKPCPTLVINGDHDHTSINPVSTFTLNDASTLLLDRSSSILVDFNKCAEKVDFDTMNEQLNGSSIAFLDELQGSLDRLDEELVLMKSQSMGQFEYQMGNMVFPCSFPSSFSDSWKPNLLWDYSSPCPSELSTSYSANNCNA